MPSRSTNPTLVGAAPEPADGPAEADAGPWDLRVLVAGGAVLVVLLALGRVLPGSEATLLLRLSAAFAAVLVFPGAVAMRLLDHGRLPQGVWFGAAVAWSVVLICAAQAVAFLVHGSLVVTGIALVVLEVALFAVGWWRRGLGGRRLRLPGSRGEWVTALRNRAALTATVATGLLLGGYIWWARLPITGDAVEHLARTRKLAELDSFDRVGVTEFFADANLHPGHAFPSWHAALALVARLAGVDSAAVIQLGSAVLTPLVLVMVFGMGTALFRTPWGGFCTAVAQAGWLGFAASGTGTFAIISGPAAVSLVAFVPVVMALVLTYVEAGRRIDLVSLVAASFAVTVIHVNYTLYLLAVLGSFAIARWLLDRQGMQDARRIAVAGLVTLASALPYYVVVVPIVLRQPQVGTTDPGEQADNMRRYRLQLDQWGSLLSVSPETIARTGPIVVVGLVGVVLALLAGRQRWAGLVLGSAGAVFVVCLVPQLFTTFTDLVSIGQARRLVNFLAIAVTVAAVGFVVGRLKVVGIGLALAAGGFLQSQYPGDFTYLMTEGGGPAWATWVAVAAVVLAVLVLPWLRGRPTPQLRFGSGVWAGAVVAALVVPLAVTGLSSVERHHGPRSVLSAGVLRELRDGMPEGSVVFSDDRTAYQTVGFAPVYVNTAVGGHVWDRRVERHKDAVRFFSPDTGPDARLALLRKYDADYVLTRPYIARRLGLDGLLDRVYVDPPRPSRRFVLYQAPQ